MSGPSVPQELQTTVPHYKIPFVPIIEARTTPHAMFTDLQEYPWVLAPVEFTSQKHLIDGKG